MQKHDLKIALEDFNTICRVCLEANGELESIYGVIVETGKKSDPIDLVKIFKRHCDVEVSPTDDKPQSICKPCLRRLCDSHAFFAKCVQSDQALNSVLCENNIPSSVPKCEQEESDVEIINLEIKIPKSQGADEAEPCPVSEGEDGVFDDCDNDSDWKPSEDLEPNLLVKLENESDRKFEKSDSSDDELGERFKKPVTRRKRLISRQSAKKRGRPKRHLEPKSEAEDSEPNLRNELICRICNEVLPDINASIDHYDEVHAPELVMDVCIFCDRPKSYKKRENLLYHMGLHSKDSVKCIPCRRYFRTKELLAEHLKECFKVGRSALLKVEEASEEGDMKPDIEQLTELSQKELNQLNQFDGAFTCQLCNQHLGEFDAVVSHFESNHMDDLFCIICLRSFTIRVPLFHLALHSQNGLVCRPCRRFFRTKDEYNEHYAKYDHDESLSCKICGKKFSRNYKKNKHMLSHLKEKNFSCSKCGKTFTYKTSLVRHFKMHFGKRFLCSSCGNAYTTKYMLQRHIRIMHTYVDEDGKPLPKPPPKVEKLQCEFCGEIFTTKYGYGRHIRRHPEFREFKCKICSFTCDTRDQLEAHMEERHNKHTCEVCGKRFPFESELKTHHRKHEDMEMARFRCDVCGKTARTQTQLRVHYRIHTGERPFSCETCGKSFKQGAHLKVHMFQHTGKMPFKCEICEKSFPFQHVMEIHMRTHTGEKPFQCVYCGNAYHDRTTMQKHQKKKHPEMPVEKVGRSDYKISKLAE